MRKLTAILLCAIVIVMSLPFTVFAVEEKVTTVDDAKDFASMKAGKSYILTKDIDLGENWTTMDEFSGALDGNGYTITVPTNAPIFEKLSGTVKNLKLDGTMTLDENDVSDYYLGVDSAQYSLGVLANRAFGATVQNVHSSVDVTFNQGSKDTSLVVFGGMFGFASPAYECDANNVVTVIRETNIDMCSINGTIAANYSQSRQDIRMDLVGGLIGLGTFDINISNTHVSADVTVTKASGYIGGIVSTLVDRIPSFTGEYTDDPLSEDNLVNGSKIPTITNCIVSGDYKRTYDTSYSDTKDRTGGIVGYAHGVEITACAYTGNKIDDTNVRSVLGYSESNKSERHYVKISGCVDTLGNVKMISSAFNSQPFDNIIVWKNVTAPVANFRDASTDAISSTNVISVKTVEEALSAFYNQNSTAFNYTDGKLSIKDLTPPAQDHTHTCDISTEVNGKLSTGMCADVDCGIVTDAPYAGFIQLGPDGKSVRVLMVITANEVEVNKDKSFVMRVTVNEKTVDIQDSQLTAYTSIGADGTLYEAEDGYYLFGVIFNFSSDMSDAEISVSIIYEGESEPVFSGVAATEDN